MDEPSLPDISTQKVEEVLGEVEHVQRTCRSRVRLLFLLNSTTEYNILATKVAEMPGAEMRDIQIFKPDTIVITIEVFSAGSNGVA
ncbi:MAG: hypothetical protein KAR39_02825 [Thermoplasmata archaeon]|nr:hypothetical protein [Thermoplasmata archaeon]